jgi:hypothetical protein
LVGSECPDVEWVDVRIRQSGELCGAQGSADGGEADDQSVARRRGSSFEDHRADVVDAPLPLALPFQLEHVGVEEPTCVVVCVRIDAGTPQLPGARRDDFLQRRRAGLADGRDEDVETVRECGGQPLRQGVGIDVGRIVADLDVDVLGDRLAPVGSASPKLILGRGVNPSVAATGISARRRARSQMRAASRWLVKRTLPSLVERKRSFTTVPRTRPQRSRPAPPDRDAA